ncbi:unnamed protein product [Acanthoscelides obtectus]|uniref:PiggyBac transposable element-derived protein domain-containing protein n=1 Tax=Acanthoscelides obtectus TaxID=200917 RepID=A0A9P0L1J4_ACAOB|nr:unnamed protein product [Acanthoscelides obtectus]CAK1650842.1 PiggyBac transposable element-derived protein 4 [Acanthoscelides obtectus]
MASPRTEAKWLKWYEEIDSDTNSCSDLDDAASEDSIHNTGTEQSSDEEEMIESISQPQRLSKVPLFVGKNDTKWLKHKTYEPSRKTRSQNIITKLPGVSREAKGAKEIIDCWQIFFTTEIIAEIVTYTNQKVDEMRKFYGRPRDCLPTDLEELMVFFGLLYLAGVKKSQHLHTSELWASDGTSSSYFPATMSQKRFHILLRALRFDDKTTRKERSNIDNFAAFRNVFDTFVHKCTSSYFPHQYFTIDKMLEAFRGRCRFRQFIKSKPAKYGLKIFVLVDSRTFYIHNMEMYCGKQPSGPYQVPNDAASIVKRLIKPINKSGRNITADNYFSSVPLANELYINHHLTYVGTLRKNKRDIPPELLQVKNRPVHSTMCAFGKCTLTSYIPKKHKNMLMISTFHDSDTIDPESRVQKAEVIMFYNSTKGGVDVADRMKAEYSVTRFSNRWPFTLFCSLQNIASINSQIIYRNNTENVISRRFFILSLAKSLIKPHMVRRSSLSNISVSLQQKICSIVGKSADKVAFMNPGEAQSKARCGFCPCRKNRFTNNKCSRCQTPLCREHTGTTVFVCYKCKEAEDNLTE